MAAFDQASSFAILFGVAHYDRATAYDSMPWIENNLSELRTILVDEDLVGFWDDDHHVLVKLNPTYGQLGDDLDDIRKKHANIDTMLVYYCGHGVVQGGKYYLTGTNSSDTIAGKLLFDTFEDLFLALKAKRKLLILDSCFSGRAVPHLSDSTSVLEVNVDRLAEKERKSSEFDLARRGTYVVASADRDQPSPSMDGTGKLTAFTSLLVHRIRHGLERRAEERLTITDIVEAVRIEALQQGLPEPVTSDKLGIGSWRLIGNAPVLKRKKFDAETVERSEKEKREAEAVIQAADEKRRAEAAHRAAEEEKREAEAVTQAADEKRRAEAAHRAAEEEKRKAEAVMQAADEKRRAEAARRAAEEKRTNESAVRAGAEKRDAEAVTREAKEKRRAEEAARAAVGRVATRNCAFLIGILFIAGIVTWSGVRNSSIWAFSFMLLQLILLGASIGVISSDIRNDRDQKFAGLGRVVLPRKLCLRILQIYLAVLLMALVVPWFDAPANLNGPHTAGRS